MPKTSLQKSSVLSVKGTHSPPKIMESAARSRFAIIKPTLRQHAIGNPHIQGADNGGEVPRLSDPCLCDSASSRSCSGFKLGSDSRASSMGESVLHQYLHAVGTRVGKEVGGVGMGGTKNCNDACQA
jgi:hypothetical protein